MKSEGMGYAMMLAIVCLAIVGAVVIMTSLASADDGKVELPEPEYISADTMVLDRGSAAGKPELHELRESGQIEQDADAVLLLDYVGARENPPTTQHAVSVAKSKEGRVGRLDFRFYGETQRFYAEDRR